MVLGEGMLEYQIPPYFGHHSRHLQIYDFPTEIILTYYRISNVIKYNYITNIDTVQKYSTVI